MITKCIKVHINLCSDIIATGGSKGNGILINVMVGIAEKCGV